MFIKFIFKEIHFWQLRTIGFELNCEICLKYPRFLSRNWGIKIRYVHIFAAQLLINKNNVFYLIQGADRVYNDIRIFNVLLLICFVTICFVTICFVTLCFVTICFVTICFVTICFVCDIYLFIMFCKHNSQKSSRLFDYNPLKNSLD